MNDRASHISRAALSALTTGAFCVGAAVLSTNAAAQSSTRQPLTVTGYVIDAQLDPVAQRLTATAAVTFTAAQDLTSATFELNNGLRITKVTGPDGKPLDTDRDARRSTVTVSLPASMPKGTTSTFAFTYAGILKEADTSPVEGIKTAALAEPISMLLYPGRWFPMVGLYTNRFTMTLHATVPSDETAIGSGFTLKKALPGSKTTEFDFDWQKPGFPGTLIAGKFLPAAKPGDARQVSIYVTEKHKATSVEYAGLAARQQEFFTQSFGQVESSKLQIVEIPEDAVSASWAPEIVAIASNRIGDKNSSRLLSNTIAHQWFGSEISPATLNDAWITNGMARYAELMNVEENAGKTALQSAIPDIEAGALAYDTAPLSTLGRTDPFSPQFQSMTLEKGAMVFHMLRFQMGDDKFLAFLKNLLSTYTDKPVRSADLEQLAKATVPDQNLTPFFAQWIDGTGAPSFQDKFTVYRLGNSKGFRTVGSVSQDLDLFRMPVDLRVETDGKTETRKIDVSGTDSAYTIETFGRPRRIAIDPENWVLKSTPDLAVRVAVLKGQQLVAQGDLIGALAEYQKALDSNRNSSLANYRIAEIFYTQRNYQSSANSYRDALRGDGDPRWSQVWSHIGLGRIFDLTGQRDRAVQEYRLAVQTNDNTQGALNEARALLQKPFERARSLE